MLDLTGKKIMVTGASSGIGRATAVLISKLGGRVVACGRDSTRLDETISECDGHNHIKMTFDVRENDSYKDIFDRIVSDGKKLDGLVYSAGIAKPTPLRVFDSNTVREILEVNLISFMTMTAVYSKKAYNNGGSIVGISAINAHYPQKCMTVYAASKMAIEGFVRTVAIELVDKNIRVNYVVPGPVNTPMGDNVLEKSANDINAKALLGLAESEDVANSIVFLLSDMSRKITGRSIFIDSGTLGQ